MPDIGGPLFDDEEIEKRIKLQNMLENKPSVDFLLKVFKATQFEHTDTLFWRMDGEYAPLSIFVVCNDQFYWGTADLEKITEDNVDLLQKSVDDCNKIEGRISMWGPSLFCSRVRKMRPQPPFLKMIDNKEIVKLFNECGPERNPKDCG